MQLPLFITACDITIEQAAILEAIFEAGQEASWIDKTKHRIEIARLKDRHVEVEFYSQSHQSAWVHLEIGKNVGGSGPSSIQDIWVAFVQEDDQDGYAQMKDGMIWADLNDPSTFEAIAARIKEQVARL